MRRALGILAIALLLAALALWASAPYVERRVADEVTRAAAAAGVRMSGVSFSWQDPLRVDGVVIDRADTGRVEVRSAEIRWDFAGGRDPRAHVRGFDLHGIRVRRGALTLELNEAAFDVVSWEVRDGIERLKLRQRPGGGEFEARWKSGGGQPSGGLSMRELDLKDAMVRWAGDPVVRPGAWTGQVDVDRGGERLNARVALSGRAVSIALPPSIGGAAGDFGAPMDVRLEWNGERDQDSVEMRDVVARFGGLHVQGQGRVDAIGSDAIVAASGSARTELGAAFDAAGIELPASVDAASGLGTAWIDLDVRGPLARPAELKIEPKLRFDPGPGAIERLQFLARPFRYRPRGAQSPILVQAGAPDFIPIGAVPPVFMRALLISEDAGFYGHPGVDVSEIPAAWADNLERGTFARGASTITQQLVKNLFLSGEKTLARKLEEAALALMVDAALTKPRILEIYVNVIEWGPGLYGLVPAARHYFGKAPADLSPKEVAFLVCLIPSPVRYHQAHAAGRAGPGMEQLMANLLAKLRSVDAIGEEDYAVALGEELAFAPEA